MMRSAKTRLLSWHQSRAMTRIMAGSVSFLSVVSGGGANEPRPRLPTLAGGS